MKVLTVLFCTALALVGFSTPASAIDLGDSWSMVPNGSTVDEIGGSNRDIQLNGDWGTSGGGVDWNTAPAWGEVLNSASSDPDTKIVAIGARIRSDDVSGRASGYSGNVIQKGLFNDNAQIKAQIVKDNSGSFNCRFEGTNTSTLLASSVSNIDDGNRHYVVCWKKATEVGVIVDGVEDTQTISIGAINPNRNILLGNKGSGGDASDQHFGKNTCSAYSYGSGAVVFVENLVSAGC